MGSKVYYISSGFLFASSALTDMFMILQHGIAYVPNINKSLNNFIWPFSPTQYALQKFRIIIKMPSLQAILQILLHRLLMT